MVSGTGVAESRREGNTGGGWLVAGQEKAEAAPRRRRQMTATRQNKKSGGSLLTLRLTGIGRDEATRTPDPYVPNVVRYQLRYIPNADAKVNEKTDNRAKNHEKIACATQNEYLCKPIQRYSY